MLAQLGIESALEARGFPVLKVERASAAANARVGITAAQLAIAATGTLVLAAGPGRSRSASLLPWVHVAVVPERALVATVEEAVARLPGLLVDSGAVAAWHEGQLPSSVTFITGPSRIADIENDLSIGVHGPGVLHVILRLEGRSQGMGAGSDPGPAPWWRQGCYLSRPESAVPQGSLPHRLRRGHLHGAASHEVSHREKYPLTWDEGER